ncbi:AAA family ATPase [Treponema sp.]|uniref:AAA family ATPase n=1 Tax=Treponema sp. TaxID=166 RepID=UPI0025803ADF|nr:AAA family ATPase [Treponema sp.]MBE6354973.1 AAA family ATPase [Treponema sp.]
MSDLFDSAEKDYSHEPLAARMRPVTLDEYVGQDHIVGKGRLLRRAIAADQLTSVIFYGPPGTGKTTLARVIANHTSSAFITLNAVLTGVADIRESIKNAEQQKKLYGRKTILFVDEVHRWNKSQQDALLPWVENGTIILIGATTENPFFEVNKALVSRSRVFQLKPLTKEDLLKAARQALSNKERGYGKYDVQFEDGALEHLVETANGDCRSLLNALELAVETTPEKWPPEAGEKIYISRETAEESIQKKAVLYDRDGDYHYDIISAFIKSLRGRDPDAACYWLARMVKAGEDPHFIFRRMLISACEDTGLADPNAISIVESCARAFDRVGLPEGRYFLAHAALYLSTAPKSNSSMAFFDALHSVETQDADVPNHLKDSSRDAEGFGHGSGYMYPHAYRDHWVAQQYLPGNLTGKIFYNPSTQGYEAKIRDEVLNRRELQIASLLEEEIKNHPENFYTSEYNKNSPQRSATAKSCAEPLSQWWIDQHQSWFKPKEENLTFTPQDRQKNALLDKAERSWRSRLDSNRAELLEKIKTTLLSMSEIYRHSRVLVWNADDALLIFDLCRKTPEGATYGVCRTKKGIEILKTYQNTLDDLDKTKFVLSSGNIFSENNFARTVAQFKDAVFDKVFLRDCFAAKDDIFRCIKVLKENASLFSEDARILLSQRIPCDSQKLSDLIIEQIVTKDTDTQTLELLKKMQAFDRKFYSSETTQIYSWDCNFIKQSLSEAGFKFSLKEECLIEKRRISPAEANLWLDSENSLYGKELASEISSAGVDKIRQLLINNISDRIFNWKAANTFWCIKL